MSISLDPDPDLGPNCLQKLSADDTSRQRVKQMFTKAGPEVIKLFPCSTHLSTKFILLINIKMPTIVGILTFISRINTTSERLKEINFFICLYFSCYEQLKVRAQSS